MPTFSRAQPRPGLGIELSMRELDLPLLTGFEIHYHDLNEYTIIKDLRAKCCLTCAL